MTGAAGVDAGREDPTLTTRIVTAADRVLRTVSLFTYRVSAAVVLLMAAATVVGTLSRQILNQPVFDTVLTGQLSVSTMTFLGLAWVFRQHRHIAAGIALERLPAGWKWRVHLVGLVAALAAVVYATGITWDFAYTAYKLGERLIGMQSVPAFPFQVIVPAGLALLSLEMLREIVFLVREREERMHRTRGYD